MKKQEVGEALRTAASQFPCNKPELQQLIAEKARLILSGAWQEANLSEAQIAEIQGHLRSCSNCAVIVGDESLKLKRDLKFVKDLLSEKFSKK